MKKTLTARQPTSLSRPPLRNLFPQSLFDEMLDQYWSGGNPPLTEMMNAAMDVAETDQVFEIKMDLPGVTADDVDIQIDHNTLTVRGHRSEKTEEKDEDKQFHRIERYSGQFSRSVMLPTAINEDETAAEFRDGVLKIVVPKSSEAQPRKIKIRN